MAYRNSVSAIAMTNITSSTVSSTYAAINATGLPHNCSIVYIVNNSTTDVTVSYDGTTDNDYVPTMTTRTLEFQTNSNPLSYQSNLAIGTKVYVKGTAGTGNIYLIGYYNALAA